ncbi:MAG: hypothetical protein BRC39_13480 [Cyanobacteria bacterium QH_7_48_89]|nr:MAG: hypothetical protein BRC39_13480 [Cyanobacteria bacterium QH_7_48_89]
MTNAETRWEGAVLNKLTNNGEGIAVVENKLDYLTENVSGLKQDVSQLQQDVSGLKQDVSGLKQDFSQLQQEVSGFKQDISQLQQDVSEIKSVLRWLKRIGIGTLTIVSMIAIGLITNAVWEFVRPVLITNYEIQILCCYLQSPARFKPRLPKHIRINSSTLITSRSLFRDLAGIGRRRCARRRTRGAGLLRCAG